MTMAVESNINRFREELESLLDGGDLLRLSLAVDLEVFDEETVTRLRQLKLPIFKDQYERWYSASMRVVKQVLPDRLADFVRQYKDEKRKQTDFGTYGVSDYMIGLSINRGYLTMVDGTAAFPKFEQQLNILKSAKMRLESSLFDMIEILQADLLDRELEIASELAGNGFLRGAGAVARVVLQQHLNHVCGKHGLKTRKRSPRIGDLGRLLLDGDVIDTPMWRFIQLLDDLTNRCQPSGNGEPTEEDLDDLISGVTKIIKTLF